MSRWLAQARDTINVRGGLFNLEKGILVDRVTSNESEMNVHACPAGQNIEAARLSLSDAVVSFLASTADGREFVKPLAVATTGARPYAWQVTRDADWFSVRSGLRVGERRGVRPRPAFRPRPGALHRQPLRSLPRSRQFPPAGAGQPHRDRAAARSAARTFPP